MPPTPCESSALLLSVQLYQYTSNEKPSLLTAPKQGSQDGEDSIEGVKLQEASVVSFYQQEACSWTPDAGSFRGSLLFPCKEDDSIGDITTALEWRLTQNAFTNSSNRQAPIRSSASIDQKRVKREKQRVIRVLWLRQNETHGGLSKVLEDEKSIALTKSDLDKDPLQRKKKLSLNQTISSLLEDPKVGQPKKSEEPIATSSVRKISLTCVFGVFYCHFFFFNPSISPSSLALLRFNGFGSLVSTSAPSSAPLTGDGAENPVTEENTSPIWFPLLDSKKEKTVKPSFLPVDAALWHLSVVYIPHGGENDGNAPLAAKGVLRITVRAGLSVDEAVFSLLRARRQMEVQYLVDPSTGGRILPCESAFALASCIPLVEPRGHRIKKHNEEAQSHEVEGKLNSFASSSVPWQFDELSWKMEDKKSVISWGASSASFTDEMEDRSTRVSRSSSLSSSSHSSRETRSADDELNIGFSSATLGRHLQKGVKQSGERVVSPLISRRGEPLCFGFDPDVEKELRGVVDICEEEDHVISRKRAREVSNSLPATQRLRLAEKDPLTPPPQGETIPEKTSIEQELVEEYYMREVARPVMQWHRLSPISLHSSSVNREKADWIPMHNDNASSLVHTWNSGHSKTVSEYSSFFFGLPIDDESNNAPSNSVVDPSNEEVSFTGDSSRSDSCSLSSTNRVKTEISFSSRSPDKSLFRQDLERSDGLIRGESMEVSNTHPQEETHAPNSFVFSHQAFTMSVNLESSGDESELCTPVSWSNPTEDKTCDGEKLVFDEVE